MDVNGERKVLQVFFVDPPIANHENWKVICVFFRFKKSDSQLMVVEQFFQYHHLNTQIWNILLPK